MALLPSCEAILPDARRSDNPVLAAGAPGGTAEDAEDANGGTAENAEGAKDADDGLAESAEALDPRVAATFDGDSIE